MAALVFNRGTTKRRFSVEPPERLYMYNMCVCVQYNKMAFSIERQRSPEGWAAVAAAVAVVAEQEKNGMNE